MNTVSLGNLGSVDVNVVIPDTTYYKIFGVVVACAIAIGFVYVVFKKLF